MVSHLRLCLGISISVLGGGISSCYAPYMPNPAIVPLFSKSGQTSITASFESTNFVNAQVAHSFSEHGGIFCGFSSRPSIGADSTRYSNRLVEGGLCWFTSGSGRTIEVLAGYGVATSRLLENGMDPVGYASARWPATTTIDAKYDRLFLQLNYGVALRESLQVALAIRLSRLHFSSFEDHAFGFSASDSSYNHDVSLQGIDRFSIEPVLCFKGLISGTENLYVTGQAGVALLRPNDIDALYTSSIISVGLELRF